MLILSFYENLLYVRNERNFYDVNSPWTQIIEILRKFLAWRDWTDRLGRKAKLLSRCRYHVLNIFMLNLAFLCTTIRNVIFFYFFQGGLNILHFAARENHLDICKVALNHGIDIKALTKVWSNTHLVTRVRGQTSIQMKCVRFSGRKPSKTFFKTERLSLSRWIVMTTDVRFWQFWLDHYC